jgi:hypothetical protein
MRGGLEAGHGDGTFRHSARHVQPSHPPTRESQVPGYSVADPGCLSRIPDPKTATKERDEKKFVIILFLKSQISQN